MTDFDFEFDFNTIKIMLSKEGSAQVIMFSPQTTLFIINEMIRKTFRKKGLFVFEENLITEKEIYEILKKAKKLTYRKYTGHEVNMEFEDQEIDPVTNTLTMTGLTEYTGRLKLVVNNYKPEKEEN